MRPDDAPRARDEAPARPFAPPIGPLSQLPLFHNMARRGVVVAGAGHGARWKAELVAASGAVVSHFVGPDAAAALSEDGHDKHHAITRIDRAWCPEDLAGAALAILDTQSDAEAQAFAWAARQAGVPVNVIDKPKWCDFQFGAIVNRSPVVIAISTHGAVPALGQLIRTRVEAMLPRVLAGWAAYAAELRRTLKSSLPEFTDRRAFWRRYADAALRADGPPDPATVAHWVDGGRPAGRVAFLDCGSGDPELLTIKGLRALQSADLLLFDAGVPSALLDYARREAERQCVGNTWPPCLKDEAAALAALAAGGRQVVRLTLGSGALLADEMAEACRAAGRVAGVVVDVIPGVSGAIGGAPSAITARPIAPGSGPKAGFLPGMAYGPSGKDAVMSLTENPAGGPHARPTLARPRRPVPRGGLAS